MAISSISELNNVAGSNTQIQYNNSGVFGASSNLTFDGTDLAVGNGAPSSYIDSVHGVIVGDTGDATSEIVIANSTTGVGEINFTDTADTTNQGKIDYNHTSDYMRLSAANSERLRINGGSGVVPVLLDGPIVLDDGNLRIQDSAGDYVAMTMYNRGAGANTSSRSWRLGCNMYTYGYFQFDSSTTHTNSAQTQTRMYIDTSGNCYNQGGTWGTISDANLKQDIAYLNDEGRSYWQEFAQLRYARFRLKSEVLEDSNAPSKLGLIAQDVQDVFPSCVSASESTTDGSIRLAVKSNILEGPIMGKVLQEAMARIETLEAQVAALQP